MATDLHSGQVLDEHEIASDDDDSNQRILSRRPRLASTEVKDVDAWNMKVHIAHRIAIRPRTKKALKGQFQKLGILPPGDWTKDIEELWKKEFSDILEAHPTWHGSYDLKDGLWARIDPDKYPYSNQQEREKARQRKLEKLRHLNFNLLQDEPSDGSGSQAGTPSVSTPISRESSSSSASKTRLKRPSPSLATGELSQKRVKLDGNGKDVLPGFAPVLEVLPKYNSVMQGFPTNQDADITEDSLKSITKKCKACKSVKPYTSRFFQCQYVDGKLWVACIACLEGASSDCPPADSQVQQQETGPSAVSAADESVMVDRPESPRLPLEQNGEDQLRQEAPSTTLGPSYPISNINAAEKGAPSSKYIRKLAASVNELGQENVRLAKELEDRSLAAEASQKSSETIISQLKNDFSILETTLGEHKINLAQALAENERLKNEIQTLRDNASSSSTTIQLLQSVNERLHTEVESLSEDKLAADAEIEDLMTVERKYKVMREHLE